MSQTADIHYISPETIITDEDKSHSEKIDMLESMALDLKNEMEADQENMDPLNHDTDKTAEKLRQINVALASLKQCNKEK